MGCSDRRKAEANGIDNLLAIDQHGQRSAHSLVLEIRPVGIPSDVVKARIVVFSLGELLIECCAAGLLIAALFGSLGAFAEYFKQAH